MVAKYWATLSIYDHRADYFRPSLLLFDRIVIPVPIHPWKDLGPEERDRLAAEATWLEDRGCAIRCDWDPRAFNEWMLTPLAVSNSINKTDPQLNTRYHVKWLVDNKALSDVEVPGGVTAFPIFASRETYLEQAPELLNADAALQATVELILDALPVAAQDTPLEDIVRLRQQGFVEHQVGKLREWQLDLLEDLSELRPDPKRWQRRLNRAEVQLGNAIADYKRAMSNEIETQRTARITTLVSVLRAPDTALGRLFSEHRDDFAMVGKHERSWKALYDKRFAFAGVICTAEQLESRH